ncbi:hypothetical protein JCM19238_2244 [Vibrio ponticus]|nr:hypothetical protein JCM19238_2244 [Vibrio ponticus]
MKSPNLLSSGFGFATPTSLPPALSLSRHQAVTTFSPN